MPPACSWDSRTKTWPSALACADILVRGSESVARSQVRIPIVRELLNRLAKGSLLFLHYLDVLPPHGSGRFTQSECLLRQLQIVCRKRHQMFGHARLSTLLCEP